MHNKLLIVIVSKRQNELNNKLKYYLKKKYKNNILIVDGNINYNLYAAKNVNYYYHLPKTPLLKRHFFSLDKINELKKIFNYILYVGDDDYALCNSNLNITNFIQKNQNYVCGTGLTYSYFKKQHDFFFKQKPRPINMNNENYKTNNLINYNSLPQIFYSTSIFPIKNYLKMLNFLRNNCSEEEYLFYHEEFLTITTLLSGKVYVWNYPHILRRQKNIKIRFQFKNEIKLMKEDLLKKMELKYFYKFYDIVNKFFNFRVSKKQSLLIYYKSIFNNKHIKIKDIIVKRLLFIYLSFLLNKKKNEIRLLVLKIFNKKNQYSYQNKRRNLQYLEMFKLKYF